MAAAAGVSRLVEKEYLSHPNPPIDGLSVGAMTAIMYRAAIQALAHSGTK